MPGAFVFLLAVALVAAAVWWRDRHTATVWEWQVGLLFHNGRFKRTLPPGRYPIGVLGGLPGRIVVHVPTTRRLLVVPMQEVLTCRSKIRSASEAIVRWSARLHTEAPCTILCFHPRSGVWLGSTY